MKLATANDVIMRGSIAISGAGPASTINSILEAVTPMVENLLDTQLTENTRLDVFDYIIPRYRKFYRPVKLYLSQALHTGTQTLEVRTSADGNMLKTSGAGDLLSSDSYVVDATRGHLTLLEDVVEGYGSVSVYYSGGLVPPTVGDVFQGVPAWLKEVAIAASIRMYHAQSLTRTRKDAKVPTNELATHVSLLLNNHYRRASEVLYPVLTVVD